MKKARKIILVITILILLNGCWGRKELNDLNVILGMALDRTEEQKFYITVLGADPTNASGGNGSGERVEGFTLLSTSGNSIFDAARNLSLLIPRRNFWSHCSVIAVSEDYARKVGLVEVIDFFTRDHARRRTVKLMVTEKKASDIYAVEPTLSFNPVSELEDINEISVISGMSVDTPLYEFVAQTKGITGIGLVNFFAVKDYGGNEKIGGRGKEKVLDGTAVFNSFKMIGRLDSKETRGANWLAGKVKGGAITFSDVNGEKNQGTLEINQVKTKIIPIYHQEKGSVKAEIEIKGTIVEYAGVENLMNEKVLKILEDNCSKTVEKEIMTAWNKAQKELMVDIFGLGDKFANKYREFGDFTPDYWNEFFLNIDLDNLSVKTNITSSGIRRRSAQGG